MKYINALMVMIAVTIGLSFVMANVLPDTLWGLNVGITAGLASGVAYLYYKNYRRQQRIDEMVSDNS